MKIFDKYKSFAPDHFFGKNAKNNKNSSNCKQNFTSLSLLDGTKVHVKLSNG